MLKSSNSPTLTLTDPHLFREACYIDGTWVGAAGRATIDVDNPATGDVVGVVPKLGRAETRPAIHGAARPFPPWRKNTAEEPAIVLRCRFDLMMDNHAE